MHNDTNPIGTEFLTAFDTLFETGNIEQVELIVNKIYKKSGGVCVEWKSEAPSHR